MTKLRESSSPTTLKFTNSIGSIIALGAGGGSQTLAQTFGLGNTTDGYNIIVTNNSKIKTNNQTTLNALGDSIQFELGSGNSTAAGGSFVATAGNGTPTECQNLTAWELLFGYN